METDNLLLTVAIIAVVVSVIGAGLTYNYLNVFKGKITGFATSGKINLTVESAAILNFTIDEINWGSGRVDDGEDNATLNTAINGPNNVTRGNWTGNTDGFRIENIGNVNITLNFTMGLDADGLLGGTGPEYEYNVSNYEGNSCLNYTGGTSELDWLGLFQSANTSTRDVCPRFPFNDGGEFNDTIRVDVRLVIPSDSKTGELIDTFTAVFAQAS